jgi:predicted acylesterase/phospholipase RssA
LRRDFPYRRLALVLSGGGAMGAYEAGALRVLERARVRPAIVAGVSVGAINAVLWVANEFRAAPLGRVWEHLRPSSIGMRRATLALRAASLFVALFAAAQALLAVAGSHETSLSRWLGRTPTGDLSSVLLDLLAWLLVMAVAMAMVRFSPHADDWLARLTPHADPRRLHRWWGRGVLAWMVLHLVTWGAGIPWPHRFSATGLLVALVLWLANRPGRAGDWLREAFARLLPETRGRALWGNAARRRLVESLVSEADPETRRLTDPATHLIISACAADSGRLCYFVNWTDVTPTFRARIEDSVGEVRGMRTRAEVVEAVVASSAIPAVFEPVRIGTQDYMDGGVFSNQPLRVVLADEADAILVVLVSPSSGPPRPPRELNTLEVGARLIELANWRDLQTELRSLPSGWTRTPGRDAAGLEPARICVVEPDGVLPGGLYGFDPANARELMRRGERDAWAGLERAGWLEPVTDEAPEAGERGPNASGNHSRPPTHRR